PRLGARIGAYPELYTVDAVRPRVVGSGFNRGREQRLIELERLELAVHRLVEGCGHVAAMAGERFRSLGGGLEGDGGVLFERGELRRAGIEQGEIGGVARAQRRKLVDRGVVFPPGGAQCEQALLDALQDVRVERCGGERAVDMAARLVERRQRRIE